jgi:hypothetical protein
MAGFIERLMAAHQQNNGGGGAKPLDENNRSFFKTAIGGAGAKELAKRMNLTITGVDTKNGVVTVNHPNGGTFAIDMNASYESNYNNLITGIGNINKEKYEGGSGGGSGKTVTEWFNGKPYTYTPD